MHTAKQGVYDKHMLYNKYIVERRDGQPVSPCFVLEPGNDPAARAAIIFYAMITDDKILSSGLMNWMIGLLLIINRGDE